MGYRDNRTRKRSRMVTEEITQVYERILDHYGPSPYKNNVRPELVVYTADDGCYGWCSWDEIGLNILYCTTPELIISTLVHEVWHLHQSPTWYTRYSNLYGERSDCHPYEIEANEVAARDWRLFL
jgi:hypothetical protein